MMEEGGSSLTKVVLARRTDVCFRGMLDPLLLLETLQERDPRAYQFCLQLPGGAAFLGSSPEQLYSRTGRCVASEAVAATRARGPPGERLIPKITNSSCDLQMPVNRFLGMPREQEWRNTVTSRQIAKAVPY
jgi:anthranilate/para-aminobenzoate synthase component I